MTQVASYGRDDSNPHSNSEDILIFLENALIVQSDRTILLEVHFPNAEAALVCDRSHSHKLRSTQRPLQRKPMSEQVRYITNEQGERVGVLLDLEAYNRLTNPLVLDEECLIGLSRDELQALADSMLAPTAQNQLDDMLIRNAESQLSADEVANLDRLLAQVDQLTILKTRARYTLHCLETLATVA